MPQCKYCGQVTVWPQPYVKGQRPNDLDTGLPHDCPAYNKPDKYIDTKPQERENGNGEQKQAQGPSRYDTAYLIPKEDWSSVKADLIQILQYCKKIDLTQDRLSIFQEGIMQEIEAIRTIVHEQQGYRKHQEQLATAEEQYDRDREDGTAGFG